MPMLVNAAQIDHEYDFDISGDRAQIKQAVDARLVDSTPKIKPIKRRDVAKIAQTVAPKRKTKRKIYFKNALYDTFSLVLKNEIRSLIGVYVDELVEKFGEAAVLEAVTKLRSDGSLHAVTSEETIYAAMKPDELVHEFINRIDPDLPRYRGKREDGDIIEWLRKTYQERGYLDDLNFSRATLRHLDKKADTALRNWLNVNKTLPTDLKIPHKRGQAKVIAGRLTQLELKAARSLANR